VFSSGYHHDTARSTPCCRELAWNPSLKTRHQCYLSPIGVSAWSGSPHRRLTKCHACARIMLALPTHFSGLWSLIRRTPRSPKPSGNLVYFALLHSYLPSRKQMLCHRPSAWCGMF
jgi:hypothetical protein